MLESIVVNDIVVKRPTETRVSISLPDGWGMLVCSAPESWRVTSAANTAYPGGKLRWPTREAEERALQ